MPSAPGDARIKVRLSSINFGARNINVYRFTPIDGGVFPAAEPGAHINVQIEEGLTRAYSLINSSPAPGEYVIAVHNNPAGRGGSQKWHRSSMVGSEYWISQPRNNFALSSTTADTYLFAGGIGITPLVNMYRHLKAAGRRVQLYYWARFPEDFLYQAELAAENDVKLFATDVPGNVWPSLSEVLKDVPSDAELYCCGPTPMLADFEACGAGRARELTHVERFCAVAPRPASQAFSVTLARRGITIPVSPDESILAACLEAGVDVSYSCEEGLCGACEVRVIAGAVQHNDSVKTPEEHDRSGTMMICCSRSKAEALTLDI